MFRPYLVPLCLVGIALGCSAADTAPTGWVEGHLSIVSLRAVEPSDEMPRQQVAPEMYREYPLVILTPDTTKQVARVIADGNGNYRVALPPGTYLLDVEGRAAKRLRGQARQLSVLPNQTIRVDMNVVTGSR